MTTQRLAKLCPRKLHDALAHYIVATKPGEADRVNLARKLFNQLRPFEQVLCRLEIAEAKRAIRGESVGVLAA